MPTRRDFLSTSTLIAAGVGGSNVFSQTSEPRQHPVAEYKPPQRSVIVTRETGDNSVAEAYAMLEHGSDTLDAALHICQAREDDPNDHSVGYGGLPNEDGIVELDACVMHGPTRRAGSVAAVHNIRHAALLARTVMEKTAHVMIVGDGATKFAAAEGFPKENLLTDDARKIWLLWKEHGQGWWGPGIDSPSWKPPTANPKSELIPRHPRPEDAASIVGRMRRLYALADRIGIEPRLRHEAALQVLWPTTGTIHVSTLNTKGEMSGATTTSGLAWKIAGRVGDSPIIGAGCYTDQNVGSAGAIGNGEENIKVAGAHTIVDQMRVATAHTPECPCGARANRASGKNSSSTTAPCAPSPATISLKAPRSASTHSDREGMGVISMKLAGGGDFTRREDRFRPLIHTNFMSGKPISL
jgi:N4-(beta-N-acetylglucosaminyl)-L-asparaginase